MNTHGLDACLRVVADRHRRRIIRHLRREPDGTTTFEELVDQVYNRAADFTDCPPPGREQLAIQLQHTHLPKLADYGLVDFERRTGIVRYHPDDQVERVLDALSGDAVMPES